MSSCFSSPELNPLLLSTRDRLVLHEDEQGEIEEGMGLGEEEDGMMLRGSVEPFLFLPSLSSTNARSISITFFLWMPSHEG